MGAQMGAFKKAGYATFLAGAILLLAVPFVTFLFDRSEGTIENKELQPMPNLIEAGSGFNEDYLSDLGSYFEERFPLRSTLISWDVDLNRAVFGESGIDKVICGSDGWLYYHETLDDYMGVGQLDERGMAAYAYDLAYLKDHVERITDGAQVIFTIAPNKNTVYPDHMPWRYLKADEPHVAQKVDGVLARKGVEYVDLVSQYLNLSQAGADSGPFLYYLQDSHWTNYGALPAYDALMQATGRSYEEYGLDDVEWGERPGDLEDMLHPNGGTTQYAPIGLRTDARCVEEERRDGGCMVEEYESAADGSLVMFGDSFRENLRQPLASNFASSTFYQYGAAYDLEEELTEAFDVVIFERVERYLAGMLDGITFPAEEIDAPIDLSIIDSDPLQVEIGQFGSYYRIDGSMGASSADSETIVDGQLGIELSFADGSTSTFKALRSISNDPGSFFAYIKGDVYDKGIVSMRAFEIDGAGQVVFCSACEL